jgi:outer membrane autotransporter protein
VIQQGPGTLTLTAANTYSGGTTISGGALQIGSGGTTGSILGNVTDNAILAFDRSDSTSFGGNISGSGVLQQNGTGTLTLSGLNSYGGGTFLNSGTLAVSSDANLGAANGGLTFNGGALQFLAGFASNRDVTLNAGGGIVDTNGNNATWGGAVAGAGGLTKTGAGILTLSGAGTYAGPTSINAGTLQAGIVNAFAPGSAYTIASGAVLDLNSFNQTVGSLAGGGSVTLGSATLSTGNDNTSTNFSGDISGVGGGLTKIGTGTFTLSGTSTYGGTTNVVGGTLIADGSIANSAFTVQSGAMLGGPGTIGALTAQSGATVAPGLVTPFTQLTVAGNASFAAGSTFLVNVNGANQNDSLLVRGSATLSGGTVDVLASGSGFTPSTRFTLLSAAGGVSGTFAQLVTSSNLAQAFTFLMPSLSYDANDDFLGFAQTTNFASVALTPNQIATAAAIQALGLGNPIYNAVVGQSFAGARQAFDALSGEVHASAVTAAFEDSRLPREAILDRLSQPFYGPVPAAMAAYAADLPAKAAAGMPRYQPPQTLNFWAQGFGDFGHSGSDGNAAALSRSTDGFVIGGDASLIGLAGGDWRFGAAGGYTFDSLAIVQRLSSGNFQSVFAGVYGGASLGAVQLRSGAIYGVNTTATSRQIIFPGFAESATSNYGGSTTQVFGEAGYRVGFTGFNLAGLAFSHAMLEPFLGSPRSTFTRTDSPRPAGSQR